jgi:hypothetical protein
MFVKCSTHTVQQDAAYLSFLLNVNTSEREWLLFWQLTASCVRRLFFHWYHLGLVTVFLCIAVWATAPICDVRITLSHTKQHTENTVITSSDLSQDYLMSTIFGTVWNWNKITNSCLMFQEVHFKMGLIYTCASYHVPLYTVIITIWVIQFLWNKCLTSKLIF